MLNNIWFFMIAASVVYAIPAGTAGELSRGVMDGAGAGVELVIFLLGSMCAWSGFLKIAERSGLTELMGAALSPVTDRLFPEYKDDGEIKGKICMNIAANFLGLGNAATPLGLSAMAAMREKSPGDAPTKGMVMFVVLNTASIQLLPVNMAALRAAAGSAEPFGVLPHIWMTSAASLLVCTAACKIMERR